MKKLIICGIISFLPTVGCLYCQATYNQSIDFSNGSEDASSIVLLEDGYILIGSGWGYEFGDYYDFKLKFAKTDFDGNVIWTNFIGESEAHLLCGIQSGIRTQDGNIVFSGSKLTAITYSVILVKLDPNTGDTLFFKEYNFDDELKGLQVNELSNGDLIILAFDDNDAFGSILIKINADGDFIWEKRYGNVNESESLYFEIENDTIHLINSNIFCTPEGYKIRTIDMNGDVVQTLTFEENCPSMGILSNQGGYYGIGANFPVPPFQTFIYRTDLEGAIQWHYNSSFDLDTLEFQDLLHTGLKELPNGDLIVWGYFASNYLGTYYGMISKINMSGEAYWERIYLSNSDIYDDSRLSDMEVGVDGEIVLLGSGFSENPIENQNFWLLKLDSMGCLIPGCDTMDISVMDLTFDDPGILVFPNPVAEEAIVQISGNTTISQQEINYRIADLNGLTIQSTCLSASAVHTDGGKLRFPLHLEQIPDGIYIMQIFIPGQAPMSVKIVVAGD